MVFRRVSRLVRKIFGSVEKKRRSRDCELSASDAPPAEDLARCFRRCLRFSPKGNHTHWVVGIQSTVPPRTFPKSSQRSPVQKDSKIVADDRDRNEMFRPRSPVLTSLSGLLLVFACGILYRANRRGGVDNGSFSQQWFWTHRQSATASTLGASDNSAVGDNIGVGQHRDLLVVDGGGGGGVDDDEERRARLAFLIMSSGDDIFKLELLLPEIYHPDNVYLVHVDAKTPQDQV